MKTFYAFITFVVTLVLGVPAWAVPLDLETCKKELEACESQKATCEEAFKDLSLACLGREVSPYEYDKDKDKPKKGDGNGGAKPPKKADPVVVCLPPAKAEGGSCVCPADTTLGGPSGNGPQPAKLMKVAGTENAYHGFCAPTYEDVRAAYNRLLDIHRATCAPAKQKEAGDEPAKASEEQKAELELNAERIKRECEQFNLTVARLAQWRDGFSEHADEQVPDLTPAAWRDIWLRAQGSEVRIDQAFTEIEALKAKVAEHDAALDELCAPKEGQPLPEACRKARKDFLVKGMAEGPWETQIIAAGFYNGRFGDDSTDSYGAEADVNFIHWVDEQNGVLVGGRIGHAWSSDSNRMLAGGRLNYIHAFDKDRVWRFRIGIMMTVEPNIVGNDATNIAPEIGFQVRPKGTPFVCDLGLAVGGSRIVQYVGGERAANSDIGWLVSPSFGCGLSLQWGGSGSGEASGEDADGVSAHPDGSVNVRREFGR
jgi:hypothetical protein